MEWDRSTRKDGHGPLVMSLFAPVDQSDVRDLAERHGLAVERYFFEMTRPLTDRLPATEVPGVRIIGWDVARSREVLAMSDAAFRDHWGHVDRTPEMWDARVTAHRFRPEWSVLAWEATGSPEGYTDELSVAASHRGRGIGSALLRESMRRFAASGMESAALGVDKANASGALGLYEALGYQQRGRTCVHQLMLPGLG